MDAAPATESQWTLNIDRKQAATLLAVLFNLTLVSTLLFSSIWREPTLRFAVLGAWAAVSLTQVFLFATAQRFSRTFTFEFIAQENHYVQAVTHFMVILYWGLWWREVYSHLVLVLVQILFAYNFEILLFWFRRQKWRFGFGPFPIVFSLNFFMWFTDKWFCLQLLTLAVTYLAKTYLTWKRGDRRTHIFNPSAFSLTLISVLLLTTGAYHFTQGVDLIASFLIGPNTIEFLFLVILISNVKFRTTLITGGAGITMIALYGLLIALTGNPLISRPFDPQVFLGAGLLVTDPATSPSSKTGKALFGIAYGTLVYLFAALLHGTGHPGYFDKILPVMILNLLAPWFDSTGARLAGLLRAHLGRLVAVIRLNSVHISVWAACFIWASPLLKTDRMPQLIATPSVEGNIPLTGMMTLLERSDRLCRIYPDMCKPFGFRGELEYWFGPEKR